MVIACLSGVTAVPELNGVMPRVYGVRNACPLSPRPLRPPLRRLLLLRLQVWVLYQHQSGHGILTLLPPLLATTIMAKDATSPELLR